jgi:hypothetical protein
MADAQSGARVVSYRDFVALPERLQRDVAFPARSGRT